MCNYLQKLEITDMFFKKLQVRAGAQCCTTEETPLSLQKLWSGDGQSEMVGNRAEKNLSWSVR